MEFTFDDIIKKLEIDKKYVEFLKNMETPLSNEALTRYILALDNAHNQLVKDMIDDCVKDVETAQKMLLNWLKKEYGKFIVDYEKKCIYTGILTSYEDEDELYNDLLNPNIKWNVTFDDSYGSNCEVLQFENGENYIILMELIITMWKTFLKQVK